MRLIQITDTHLGPHTGEALLGLNTDDSLEDVLQLIQRNNPEFHSIMCTGDIASDPHIECYYRFVSHVRRYFSHPLGWLPGNHDAADMMADPKLQTLAEARVMALGNWRIVMLDSSVPGEVYGQLAASELDFLEHYLNSHGDCHIAIALHHQPVAIGSAWMDAYLLRNAEAFFALVGAYPQVKWVTWGHVHQEFASRKGDIALFATPSTCVQFKPHCDDFTVDTQMPGYRWFDLNDDGSFSTGVERVTGKQYVIDYKSAGY